MRDLTEKKVHRKSKHEFYVQHFSSKNRAFSEEVTKKMVRVGQATDDTTHGASAFRARQLRQDYRHTLVTFNT